MWSSICNENFCSRQAVDEALPQPEAIAPVLPIEDDDEEPESDYDESEPEDDEDWLPDEEEETEYAETMKANNEYAEMPRLVR